MNIHEKLTLAASGATSLGILAAAWQLWLTHRQQIVQFEDTLNREYRELAERLPVKAHFGESLSDKEHVKKLEEFYRYIDLTNEQVFLRQRGRVSKKTWVMWRDGIRSNFRRPAFKAAWEEIKRRSNGDFKELRALEASNFSADPFRRWYTRNGPIARRFGFRAGEPQQQRVDNAQRPDHPSRHLHVARDAERDASEGVGRADVQETSLRQ
jgi:hypothetical protein